MEIWIGLGTIVAGKGRDGNRYCGDGMETGYSTGSHAAVSLRALNSATYIDVNNDVLIWCMFHIV